MSKNIKVSIATIQGFLLLYKKDPVMALDKVDQWAEGIRQEQFPNVELKLERQEIGTEHVIEVGEKAVVEGTRFEVQEVEGKEESEKP
jgi:hypothetical protein